VAPGAGQDAVGADGPALREARDRHLADCLHRVARGDAAAFEAFHDATIGYAQGFARRWLAGADGDDLLADVYFEVWRTAPRFDAARGSAVTWLLTLVRSRALDALRLKQTHPSVGGSEGLDGDADLLPAADLDPADQLWQHQSEGRLHEALHTLGAAERWVLGLAYFRELSHAQIAAATGMPLGTVKSLIHRAQQRLRERLQAP
jgi:RNA polymerase sigma-70 factor (ECF subfamily)